MGKVEGDAYWADPRERGALVTEGEIEKGGEHGPGSRKRELSWAAVLQRVISPDF